MDNLRPGIRAILSWALNRCLSCAPILIHSCILRLLLRGLGRIVFILRHSTTYIIIFSLSRFYSYFGHPC